MADTIEQNPGHIYYPPGGILIWTLIILEMITFLGASLIFMYHRGNNLEEFAKSREMLNPLIGTINTIILITSGYFIAISVQKLRGDQVEKSARFMLVGLLLGLAFLGIKGMEFYDKIELGLHLGSNTFFTFYWLTTGFHFIHVLFGVGLLAYMYFAIKKKKYSAEKMLDIETSATYWHMCDLIWILIFPVFYLI